MATLVLTVVGGIVGGPIGAAIGAAVGNVIDREVLFAPKGRQGPRLSDLRLQTSSYGTQVPKIFGTMRVAGSVIWATDLKEHVKKQGGGKGQPKVTTYSYSASLAVALSARPIGEVRRIWADGNLLRGTAGDFKTGINAFRLYDGTEDQAVDPLIGAAVGAGRASAHRGIAYAVFEDLQLADYGNRIPSLTFEVVAEEGVVAVDRIAAELSGGAIQSNGGAARAIGGYAASGTSVADALAPLVDGYDLALRADENGAALMGAEAGTPLTIPRDWHAGIVNGRASETTKRTRDRADQVPVRLSVRHYDVARDYQAGVQTATRAGPGLGERSIDLPATIDAGALRALAEERLQGMWTGRSRIELRCDWRALEIVPGDIVEIDGQGGKWRVERSEWEAMAVTLRLRQIATGPVDALPAGSGAAVAQTDVTHGATRIAVVELPAMGDELVAEPIVAVAASGSSTGWRQAALFTEDAQGGLTQVGPTALPATMGRLVSGMSATSALLVDAMSAPVIELVSDARVLVGADDASLAVGANMAMIGDELVQFGNAVPVGARQYRLERLWRGRRGTEAAIAAHPVDTPFVLLDAERLAVLPVAKLHPGDLVRVRAIGIGDNVPAQDDRIVNGLAMMPVAPVHGTVKVDGAGGKRLGWVRRSRNGWRWRDGVDVPLGEEREGYAIALSRAGTVFRRVEVAGPEWTYDAATIATDITAGNGGAVVADIRQIGTHGLSPALSIAFIL